MEKQPLSLRERQLEYLRILKELDRYCSETGLRYYIGCGTLIGAVRHKGFIPWDDDLDVFMPRPDYMRFINDYKSDKFTIHTIYNDKSHPYNFARFCCEDVFSFLRGEKRFNFGIDVYVINGAPSDRNEQLKLIDDTFRHINRVRSLVKLRDRLLTRGLWPFKSLDFSLLNKELIEAEKCFMRYDYFKSDYIWPFGGGKLIIKKENYGTPVGLEFEDGLFMAPEHYHEVLSIAYGDYMQLPPENERVPYHGGKFYKY